MKPSSPRLWPGQTAENELGFSYEIIDTILYNYFDLKREISEIHEETEIPIDTIQKVVERVLKNEHKRMTPPIPKLGGVSIGSDWKMPFIPDL